MSVTLINLFSVPKGTEGRFLKWLQDEKGTMSNQQGFMSGKLEKSVKPDSKFNFINIVVWESAAALSKAVEKSGAAMQANLEQMGVDAALDLYQVVSEY
jgi:heme oxygenase (mycobilin-producing)